MARRARPSALGGVPVPLASPASLAVPEVASFELEFVDEFDVQTIDEDEQVVETLGVNPFIGERVVDFVAEPATVTPKVDQFGQRGMQLTNHSLASCAERTSAPLQAIRVHPCTIQDGECDVARQGVAERVRSVFRTGSWRVGTTI